MQNSLLNQELTQKINEWYITLPYEKTHWQFMLHYLTIGEHAVGKAFPMMYEQTWWGVYYDLVRFFGGDRYEELKEVKEAIRKLYHWGKCDDNTGRVVYHFRGG